MADDGMLLNFELPSDAFVPVKTIKGGSWKDRLTARKSAQWGRQKAQERVTASRKSIPRFGDVRSEDEELILPDNQPSKRARTGGDGAFKPVHGTVGTRISSGEGHQRSLPRTTNGEFISSLFTYNPKSTGSQSEQPGANDANLEPSNAPLQDELATFTSLGLSTALASHLLKKLEIKAPTAIQRRAVQRLCAHNTDAFIQAETGSGKTLAYLLPIVQRIMQLSQQGKDSSEDFGRESGLLAIILAPTRELSKQISTVLDNLLSCCHWIVGGTVIGGEKKKSEKARLRKGLNILIATPGRLADHLDNTEVLNVSRVRWLVLDEGDRLMELGFEKDIQKIVSVLNIRGRKPQGKIPSGLPERRTTILCSATMKNDINQLKSIALKDPVSIAVDEDEKVEGVEVVSKQQFAAPAQLKQSYALVPPKQRLATLVATLKHNFRRKGSVMKCIVFMSCADSVDFHFDVLTRPTLEASDAQNDGGDEHGADEQLLQPSTLSRSDKIPQGNTISENRTQGLATAFSSPQNPVWLFRLHGSLQQSTRTSTLMAFTKSTEPAVLVCTDVASRGLDLPDIDLVIEYDAPFSKDDHLHRIGRTARAGKEGRAMIFLMPGCEEGYVDVLKEGRPHHLTKHTAEELLRKGFAPTSGMVSEKAWEDQATAWQLDVEHWAIEHPKHLEQARRAFQSHVRAYATHVTAERSVFDLKQLHLGHLAKAFGLRDRPGSIRVPGLRPSKDAHNKSQNARKVLGTKKASPGTKRPSQDNNLEDQAAIDERDARRKMQAKIKALSGASEFNLG